MDSREFLESVDWETNIYDVRLIVEPDPDLDVLAQWACTVRPKDQNDKGSEIPIEIDHYLIDNAGNQFRIIDKEYLGVPGDILVSDDFNCGMCPQPDLTGLIVKTVGDGSAPHVASAKLDRLDKIAKQAIDNREKDILWKFPKDINEKWHPEGLIFSADTTNNKIINWISGKIFLTLWPSNLISDYVFYNVIASKDLYHPERIYTIDAGTFTCSDNDQVYIYAVLPLDQSILSGSIIIEKTYRPERYYSDNLTILLGSYTVPDINGMRRFLMQWGNRKENLSLTNTHIFVGNASNIAVDVAMSGDATISNTGVIAVNKTRLNVRNETGVTIATTRAVYASGFNNYPLIHLADNTDEAKHNVIGVTVGSITNESNGIVATSGQCDAETNAWNVGDELYLSTSGNLVTTEPTSGSVQHVGIVTVKENYPVGKILLYKQPEGSIVSGGANQDIIFRTGDSAGTNKFSFRNYANTVIAYINSLGLLEIPYLRIPTGAAAGKVWTSQDSAGNGAWEDAISPIGFGVTTFIKSKSATGIFNLAHSSVVHNDKLYIGERATNPKIVRFNDPDDLSDYTSLTITGVGSSSAGLETGFYVSSIDRVCFIGRNNTAGFDIIAVDTATMTPTSHNFPSISGLGAIGSTDGTYIYFCNYNSMHKIRVSDWTIITSVGLPTGIASPHSMQVNVARGELYITGSVSDPIYFAKVNTSDLSSISVNLSAYITHATDDMCFYDDGTTNKVFIGGEAAVGTDGFCGIVIETTNSNAISVVEIKPSYGLFNDGVKIYNCCLDGYIQTFSALDPGNISTFQLSGYIPNEVLILSDGRTFLTHWNSTASIIAEFYVPVPMEIGAITNLVTSVFGRTGDVVANTGDYTAAQVTNAAATNASNTFSESQVIQRTSSPYFYIKNTGGTTTGGGYVIQDESGYNRITLGYNNNTNEIYFYDQFNDPFKIILNNIEQFRLNSSAVFETRNLSSSPPAARSGFGGFYTYNNLPYFINSSGTTFDLTGGGGGSMVYPSGSGIAIVAGGVAWGTTIALPGSTNTFLRGDGNFATPAGGGTVTSVVSGNGMNFTTITGAGNVDLGTPTQITSSSTDAVTATSHSHSLDNTGVSPGSYINANITVDAKGRITTASSGDSTSLSNYLQSNKIFEYKLDFTPATVFFSGAQSMGSSILENEKYIICLFNDSSGGEYLHHYILRYNKATARIDKVQITTTNSYYNEVHKLPSCIMTNSGTLLVAIEQLVSNGSHNGPISIFRWENLDDLATYTQTTVGNSSTARLAYPFLFEIGDSIVLEVRRWDTTPQYRSYSVSSDDGSTWSAVTDYITYGDADYWMYSAQVRNNIKNRESVILAINPQNDASDANCYQYVTFLRTDFANVYALDGTDLGSSVTGTELASKASWGDTAKNTNLYYARTFKIFGNEIYAIGFIGTRTSAGTNVTSNQIFKVNISTGVVTSGTTFTPLFSATTLADGILFELGGDKYYKQAYGGDIYYYKLNSDLSGMTLELIETGNYTDISPSNVYNGLHMDYDTVTGILRVFRYL